MRHFLSIAVVTLLALSITACKQDPTCESVAEHVLSIAKTEMAKMLEKLPEEQRKQLEERMATDMTKEKMAEECNKQKPSVEALQCAMNAKTMEDMAKCDMSKGQEKAEAEAPAAGGAEAEKPAAPAETGSATEE